MLSGSRRRGRAGSQRPDETRVARAPASWEKLLVDAAVIGGRDRWRRRLRGLEREFELRLENARRAKTIRGAITCGASSISFGSWNTSRFR